MKQIFLLRHAKTEPYAYHKDDFKRNLTVRGVSDCHLIGHQLKAKGYNVQHIIASPANRAVQTAELFAETFSIAKSAIQFHKPIYEGMTTQGLLNLFMQLPQEIDTAMLVGHNPDIMNFAYRICKDFNYNVPTCSTIVLQTAISNWQDLGNKKFNLQDFFVPKFLK